MPTSIEAGRTRQIEIGYVCSHGHYAFYADPEGTSCGSKRVAGIYADREAEFYAPYERADEDGHVWLTSCGYSEEDYIDNIKQAEASLAEKIAAWRAS